MNVLLVTSWGQPQCGIQAHSELLIAEMDKTDDIHVEPSAALLDPNNFYGSAPPAIVHLNYHRALHSRWTPEVVAGWKAARHPIVITFHDTFGEHPPDQLSADLCAIADAFIVHEPITMLKHPDGRVDFERAIYWRMGVPAFSGCQGLRGREQFRRPTLGTIGFNFGWKNWPELARLTKAAGWGFLICTPDMSMEDEERLRAINPWLDLRKNLPTVEVIDTLHECDATAFTNVCANSGQSAAILMGIAARKPVIALSTCRQYRGLYGDPLGFGTIRWAETFDDVQNILQHMTLTDRFDSGIVALAEQDGWTGLGQRYANLYRRLVT